MRVMRTASFSVVTIASAPISAAWFTASMISCCENRWWSAKCTRSRISAPRRSRESSNDRGAAMPESATIRIPRSFSSGKRSRVNAPTSAVGSWLHAIRPAVGLSARMRSLSGPMSPPRAFVMHTNRALAMFFAGSRRMPRGRTFPLPNGFVRSTSTRSSECLRRWYWKPSSSSSVSHPKRRIA